MRIRKIIHILKENIFSECTEIYIEAAIAVLIAVAITGFELLQPKLYSYFIDDVIGLKSINNLWVLVIGLASLFMLNVAFGLAYKSIYCNIRKKYISKVRTKLWNRIVSMPYNVYHDTSISDWKTRIDTDTDSSFDFLNMNFLELPILIIKMLAASLIIIFTCKWLSVILIPVIIIIVKAQKIVEKASYRICKDLRQAKNDNTQWLYNVIPLYQDIKVNNLEFKQLIEYAKQRHNIVNFENERAIKSFVPNFIFFQYFNTLYVAKIILYFLCAMAMFKNSAISIGTMLAYISYYSYLFEYFKTFNQQMINNKSIKPSLEKICELLEYVAPDDYLRYAKSEDTLIRVHELSFSYDENNDIINNLNFSVKRGDRVRISGISGSGKTSLINLLLGFYKPQKGSISVAYEDYEDYCKNIGVVFQEPFLYNVSIKENLLLAKPNASYAEIVRVCEMIGITDFINELPDKYDTIIGENGTKLSGGQKQLLQMAKIILKDPELIILDEATSAIDMETEKRINKILFNLDTRKTFIIISHRVLPELFFTQIVYVDNVINRQ